MYALGGLIFLANLNNIKIKAVVRTRCTHLKRGCHQPQIKRLIFFLFFCVSQPGDQPQSATLNLPRLPLNLKRRRQAGDTKANCANDWLTFMASLSEVAVAGATEPRAFGAAWSPIRMGIIMMFIFWESIWDIYMIYDIYICIMHIYIWV